MQLIMEPRPLPPFLVKHQIALVDGALQTPGLLLPPSWIWSRSIVVVRRMRLRGLRARDGCSPSPV